VTVRENPMVAPLRASIDQLKGLPPALIINGECDVLRDEGEAYAHKLLAAGVPVVGVRYQGVIHDFAMLNGFTKAPAVRAAIDQANSELRKAFATD
jgi:acetyl esterase